MSVPFLTRDFSAALGVEKCTFKLRPHSVTYKPHVLFRRVEIQHGDGGAEGRNLNPPIAYFSLFAAKAINVKPGKEILFAVSGGGGDDEHACILEASAPEQNSVQTSSNSQTISSAISDNSDVEMADTLVDGLVPPKMRKTWGRRPSSSAPSESFRAVKVPTYQEAGVQTSAAYSNSSIQATPATVAVHAQTLSSLNSIYSSVATQTSPTFNVSVNIASVETDYLTSLREDVAVMESPSSSAPVPPSTRPETPRSGGMSSPMDMSSRSGSNVTMDFETDPLSNECRATPPLTPGLPTAWQKFPHNADILEDYIDSEASTPPGLTNMSSQRLLSPLHMNVPSQNTWERSPSTLKITSQSSPSPIGSHSPHGVAPSAATYSVFPKLEEEEVDLNDVYSPSLSTVGFESLQPNQFSFNNELLMAPHPLSGTSAIHNQSPVLAIGSLTSTPRSSLLSRSTPNANYVDSFAAEKVDSKLLHNGEAPTAELKPQRSVNSTLSIVDAPELQSMSQSSVPTVSLPTEIRPPSAQVLLPRRPASPAVMANLLSMIDEEKPSGLSSVTGERRDPCWLITTPWRHGLLVQINGTSPSKGLRRGYINGDHEGKTAVVTLFNYFGNVPSPDTMAKIYLFDKGSEIFMPIKFLIPVSPSQSSDRAVVLSGSNVGAVVELVEKDSLGQWLVRHGNDLIPVHGNDLCKLEWGTGPPQGLRDGDPQPALIPLRFVSGRSAEIASLPTRPPSPLREVDRHWSPNRGRSLAPTREGRRWSPGQGSAISHVNEGRHWSPARSPARASATLPAEDERHWSPSPELPFGNDAYASEDDRHWSPNPGPASGSDGYSRKRDRHWSPNRDVHGTDGSHLHEQRPDSPVFPHNPRTASQFHPLPARPSLHPDLLPISSQVQPRVRRGGRGRKRKSHALSEDIYDPMHPHFDERSQPPERRPRDVLTSAMVSKPISEDSTPTLAPPPRRILAWPSLERTHVAKLSGGNNSTIQDIKFSGDGAMFAVRCGDYTVRIFDTHTRTESDRLDHSGPLVGLEWINSDSIFVLESNGTVAKWSIQWERMGPIATRRYWTRTTVLDCSSSRRSDVPPICFVFHQDRIAIVFPDWGVKIWVYSQGAWKEMRGIQRPQVTTLKFIRDGEALMGGTVDGVIWTCEVPNGTLRACAFFKGKVNSLDFDSQEARALVSMASGEVHIISIPNDGPVGQIEQTLPAQDDLLRRFPPTYSFDAIFTGRGDGILHGALDDTLVVWDRISGQLVLGLECAPGEGHSIQTAYNFTGYGSTPDSFLLTGTNTGLLVWWPQPEVNVISTSKRPKIA